MTRRPLSARRWATGLCVQLALSWAAGGASLAAEKAPPVADERAAPPDARASLHGARWRLEAFGERMAGSACWLRRADGALRVELVREQDGAPTSPSQPWRRLLDRDGEGWTVCGAPGGDALLQPWGDRFERLQARPVDQLALLCRVIEGGPGGPAVGAAGPELWLDPPRAPAATPRRPGLRGASAQRPVASLPDSASLRLLWPGRAASERAGRGRWSAFRARMTHRGWGRGAADEIWTLRWVGPLGAADGRELQVTSSRHAGRVTISPGEASPQLPAPDLVFVPIWSLGELLELPDGWPPDGGGQGSRFRR